MFISNSPAGASSEIEAEGLRLRAIREQHRRSDRSKLIHIPPQPTFARPLPPPQCPPALSVRPQSSIALPPPEMAAEASSSTGSGPPAPYGQEGASQTREQ